MTTTAPRECLQGGDPDRCVRPTAGCATCDGRAAMTEDQQRIVNMLEQLIAKVRRKAPKDHSFDVKNEFAEIPSEDGIWMDTVPTGAQTVTFRLEWAP